MTQLCHILINHSSDNIFGIHIIGTFVVVIFSNPIAVYNISIPYLACLIHYEYLAVCNVESEE